MKAMEGYRFGSMFDPPSLGRTVILPGVWGGANWGGAAFDPETGLLYVRSIEWPFVFKLDKPEPGARTQLRHRQCPRQSMGFPSTSPNSAAIV
jgi:glucose dehydrogenase